MSANKLKVLFVSSEAAPFAKTGGLADVCAALPAALREAGDDVRVFIPFYRMVKRLAPRARDVLPCLPIPVLERRENSSVLQLEHEGGIFYFLRNDKYYDREQLYGTPDGDYLDNAERFIYFCKAVLEAVKQLDFRPDVIHCHDWQTGLIPVYLKSVYRDSLFFHHSASMFTIHNLAYQGVFWHWDIHLTGLGWEYFVPNWIEFYGKINLMKAGILHADCVTTVSEQYAREIQSEEFGCGLEGVLRARVDDLYGILNGIDYRKFDPAHDPDIAQNYDAATLEKKSLNKKALQAYYRLSPAAAPLIGVVSRLVEQKGVDLLLEAADGLLEMGFQLAILGTGSAEYHRRLEELARRYPERVGLRLGYDAKLAQLIYAGSDFFLMPSRYEPCGLGQLMSLRYGTIPVVRYTGGLVDTVREFDPQTGSGTGFGFRDYSGKALLETARRALRVYKQKRLWRRLRCNAFDADFSWRRSAQKYRDLYYRIHRRKHGWRQPS